MFCGCILSLWASYPWWCCWCLTELSTSSCQSAMCCSVGQATGPSDAGSYVWQGCPSLLWGSSCSAICQNWFHQSVRFCSIILRYIIQILIPCVPKKLINKIKLFSKTFSHQMVWNHLDQYLYIWGIDIHNLKAVRRLNLKKNRAKLALVLLLAELKKDSFDNQVAIASKTPIKVVIFSFYPKMEPNEQKSWLFNRRSLLNM